MFRYASWTLGPALACALLASCGSAATAQVPIKPVRYRGLYLPNHRARDLAFVRQLVEGGKSVGINMLLLDAQRYMGRVALLNPEVVPYLKSQNIHAVARVVCFQDGVTRLPVPEKRMQELLAVVQEVGKAGYDEVQLDYVRFADGGVGYSLQRKYEFIEQVIESVREITKQYGASLSADIFGRIVYNRNDPIGQQLEMIARHTDAIYPMLYPSHFTNDRRRMSNPGETMVEGIENALSRLQAAGLSTRIQPFVQAFAFNIGYARTNLTGYIQLQVSGVESTKARGWVAWNAYGNYTPVFEALQNLDLAAKP